MHFTTDVCEIIVIFIVIIMHNNSYALFCLQCDRWCYQPGQPARGLISCCHILYTIMLMLFHDCILSLNVHTGTSVKRMRLMHAYKSIFECNVPPVPTPVSVLILKQRAFL